MRGRFASMLLAAACATGRDVERVEDDVYRRTGHELDLARVPEARPELPPGVRLDDGVTQDEAVAIAIWNSPRLRADLTRLAFARGDFADARRPTNPTLRFLFPAGPQQLGALLTWPLENLLFMRRRAAVARTNLDVVAQSTVQTVLDLARDVRLAHVEWLLAIDRVEVRRAIARQADGIAVIAEARGTAGDAPLAEGDAARADARVAADEANRAEVDVEIASARLAVLIGWSEITAPLRRHDDLSTAEEVARDGDLESVALESRPDLRATKLAIETAQARVRLERVAAVKIAGVGSLQGRSVTGGVQAELPLFNQNQGGIARARADLEGAKWRHEDLRARIVAEVAVGRAQLERALGSLAEYRDTIVSARQRDVEAVTAAYDAGETDYSAVFLAAQRLESARMREVELVAELRRSSAELERAVGRRLARAAKGVQR